MYVYKCTHKHKKGGWTPFKNYFCLRPCSLKIWSFIKTGISFGPLNNYPSLQILLTRNPCPYLPYPYKHKLSNVLCAQHRYPSLTRGHDVALICHLSIAGISRQGYQEDEMLAEHIDTLKRLPSVHLSKNGSLGAAIIPSGQLQIYVTLPQNCTAGLILLLLLARLCVLVLLLHLKNSIDGCLL